MPGYQTVNKLELSRGRFLLEKDDDELDNYCVLGAEAADKLFPYEDPIDQTVGIRSHFFRVVGVVRDRTPTGGSGGSQAAEDFNRDIYIPLRTSYRRFGEVIAIRNRRLYGCCCILPAGASHRPVTNPSSHGAVR